MVLKVIDLPDPILTAPPEFEIEPTTIVAGRTAAGVLGANVPPFDTDPVEPDMIIRPIGIVGVEVYRLTDEPLLPLASMLPNEIVVPVCPPAITSTLPEPMLGLFTPVCIIAVPGSNTLPEPTADPA